jgi:hypothetical protein
MKSCMYSLGSEGCIRSQGYEDSPTCSSRKVNRTMKAILEVLQSLVERISERQTLSRLLPSKDFI